jgi:hypothetical protein
MEEQARLQEPDADVGLPPGASPRIGREELMRFLLVAGQLALVLLAIRLFAIESSRGFTKLIWLVFGGFVVHARLPMKLRPPFFLLLCVAAIGVVLGPLDAARVVGIGAGLVGLCHVPVPFGARVALLVAAAAALALLRGGGFDVDWAPTVLPVIGSMFMFRLAVYLYDLRHEQRPARPWERLSYFFLLPNPCFPLFPIVDYATWRRSWYSRDAHEIHQKGVLWMLRGTIQLLAYRFIYHRLLPDASRVEGLFGVAQFVVTTYLLYLRISGQFHLIAGTLCLFGFDLPETHRRYLLASSFNDFWRRINVYWKDFMMKLFFYPALMRLRGWRMASALAVATPLVFAATWLLHAYQWFWLRGTAYLTTRDTLFWAILGVAVTVNSILEARRRPQRRPVAAAPGWRDAFALSAKTVGTFVTLALLWSLWSSSSVGEWTAVISSARSSGPAAYAALLAVLLGLVGAGAVAQRLGSAGLRWSLSGVQPAFRVASPATAATAGALVVAYVLGGGVDAGQRGRKLPEWLSLLTRDRLNVADAARMERGYYEGLLRPAGITSALWIDAAAAEPGVPIMFSDAVQRGAGLLNYELKPSFTGVQKGAPFRTNSWGLRDREYALEPEPGTFRIALLGASYAMGPGVRESETAEQLVEDRLNRERAGDPWPRCEILNFSVGGYSVLHDLELIRRKVFGFRPDAVFVVLHSAEYERLRTHLKYVVNWKLEVSDAFLRGLLDESGAEPEIDYEELDRRLGARYGEILRFALAEIGAACRARGIRPVALFLPMTPELRGSYDERFEEISGMAREAGFLVWRLDDAYGDADRDSIRLLPTDHHPNVEGHRRIAAALFRRIVENPQALERPSSVPAGGR